MRKLVFFLHETAGGRLFIVDSMTEALGLNIGSVYHQLWIVTIRIIIPLLCFGHQNPQQSTVSIPGLNRDPAQQFNYHNRVTVQSPYVSIKFWVARAHFGGQRLPPKEATQPEWASRAEK